MSRTRLRVVLFSGVLALGLVLWAKALLPPGRPLNPAHPSFAEDPAAVFAWFDTLGFPDLKGRKFVKVTAAYAAVPRLIDALDDLRFCRSVGYHRNFYFSHYTLRVGDRALAVLERIAGRTFWEPTSTFSYMTMDGKTGEAMKKARAWYAGLQMKGEK